MRKWLGVLITALAAGVVVYLLLLERQGDRPVVAPSSTKEDAPSLPNVSLQVNGEEELLIHQGTPLIFSVRLANQQAMNAAAYNEANQTLIEEIQADAASGKMSREQAEAEIAQLSRKEEIRAVYLGDERTGWEQFLRFELQLQEGKRQLLPWPLKIVAQPEKTAILDDENTAQLDYALEPSAATHIPVSEYRIVAMLEVPPNAKLPADRWRGRVESEPVKLRIVERPALLAKTDEEKMNIDLARYYFTAGDMKNAIEHAQKALSLNPKSIAAYIIIGDSKETLGDLEGALAAYQSATREYYQQRPKPYEAPRYLIVKTESLMEKLRLIEKPEKK